VTVGLIGFGRIGRLLTRHFARDVEIFVADAKPDARAVRALGAVPDWSAASRGWCAPGLSSSTRARSRSTRCA
jgi:hypothetical protein